jgi:hypothetical protein
MEDKRRRGSGAEDFSAVTHVIVDPLEHRLFRVSHDHLPRLESR